MGWELRNEKRGPRFDDRKLIIRNWDLRIESRVFSRRELGFERRGVGSRPKYRQKTEDMLDRRRSLQTTTI